MNETLDTKDMDITLSSFGMSVPKAEGEPVEYDRENICEVEAERDHYECEKNVDFGGGDYDPKLDDA